MKSPTYKTLTKQPAPLPSERQQAVTLSALLESNKITLASILPPGTPVERYILAAKMAVERNEMLKRCSPSSLYAAILQSAYLGLEIGHGNQAHLVPYFDGKTQTYRAQFQIGYQGIRRLGRLYGDVVDDDVGIVCERDVLEFEVGPHASFRHTYNPLDRGEIVAYYCWAKPKEGSLKVVLLSKQEIEAHRVKTAKKGKDGQPVLTDAWARFYDEMAIKTCVLRCYKYLAQSPQLARAIELDEMADAGIPQNLDASVHDAELAQARAHNQRAIEAVKHADLKKDQTEPKKEDKSMNEGAASAQPPADVSETDAPPSVAPSPSPEQTAEEERLNMEESMRLDLITTLREAATPQALNAAYKALPADVQRQLHGVYWESMSAFKRGRNS